jgi:hypothetical protein
MNGEWGKWGIGGNTVRLRRLSVETERGKTRERGKRGEINLKSCLFPHFPHPLISLSFQAYPNSIAWEGLNQP